MIQFFANEDMSAYIVVGISPLVGKSVEMFSFIGSDKSVKQGIGSWNEKGGNLAAWYSGSPLVLPILKFLQTWKFSDEQVAEVSKAINELAIAEVCL